MPRALFEKTGNAVYISHLDLMRVFQRAFKRANLPLTHTKGFNPRPSVSIALPLSLGIESQCEFLDFELEGEQLACTEIRDRLNEQLISGVVIHNVYENADKLKNLAFLDCCLTMEYDHGVPHDAVSHMEGLFKQEEVLVEKKGKNGITEQNIIPMIQNLSVMETNANEVCLVARINCQNPSLNPMQIAAAVSKYLPDLIPDFTRCRRLEVYNNKNEIFR